MLAVLKNLKALNALYRGNKGTHHKMSFIRFLCKNHHHIQGEKMNINNIENEQELEQTIQAPEPKGQWMTIYLTPEESANVQDLKSQWKGMGLTLPYSKILRALMLKGIENVDFDQLKANPMGLFEGLNDG